MVKKQRIRFLRHFPVPGDFEFYSFPVYGKVFSCTRGLRLYGFPPLPEDFTIFTFTEEYFSCPGRLWVYQKFLVPGKIPVLETWSLIEKIPALLETLSLSVKFPVLGRYDTKKIVVFDGLHLLLGLLWRQLPRPLHGFYHSFYDSCYHGLYDANCHVF